MIPPHDAARRTGSIDSASAGRQNPEPDAPVRFARREASLCPSALGPVADARLLARELERLLEDRLDDARDIEVVIDGGSVVLHGIVSTPLARLLAEDLAYSMPEVLDCHNELVVRATDDAPMSAA